MVAAIDVRKYYMHVMIWGGISLIWAWTTRVIGIDSNMWLRGKFVYVFCVEGDDDDDDGISVRYYYYYYYDYYYDYDDYIVVCKMLNVCGSFFPYLEMNTGASIWVIHIKYIESNEISMSLTLSVMFIRTHMLCNMLYMCCQRTVCALDILYQTHVRDLKFWVCVRWARITCHWILNVLKAFTWTFSAYMYFWIYTFKSRMALICIYKSLSECLCSNESENEMSAKIF